MRYTLDAQIFDLLYRGIFCQPEILTLYGGISPCDPVDGEIPYPS